MAPRRRRVTLAQVRKAVTAASGAASVLVAQGLLAGRVENWVTGSLAAATAALVYLVPNAPPTAEQRREDEISAALNRDARRTDPQR
jgi:hypothetical protein